MTSDEAAAAVVDALTALDIPYLLAGSFAGNFWGIPRATQDADFVVVLAKGQIAALKNRLGPAFRFDPQMKVEMVTATPYLRASVVETEFQIELFFRTDDPHDRERFRRRRMFDFLQRQVVLPTAEDFVVTKLRWWAAAHRDKDRADARNVLAVQWERLAWDYLGRWCDEHGTREALEELRRSLPR